MQCTYIEKTWTENTGGGCMVDFVQLDDGRIISVNDESVCIWASYDAFWKAAEDGETECEMHHWMAQINPLFKTPLNNPDEAIAFLNELHNRGMLFHPEDNARDIINSQNGKRLFNPSEAYFVNKRREELFQLLDDPCEIAVDLLNGEIATDETRSYGNK